MSDLLYELNLGKPVSSDCMLVSGTTGLPLAQAHGIIVRSEIETHLESTKTVWSSSL
jgi:hypothetical protein